MKRTSTTDGSNVGRKIINASGMTKGRCGPTILDITLLPQNIGGTIREITKKKKFLFGPISDAVV